MAIAKMSRLRLVGLKSDKNRIMNELVRSGSFEATSATVNGETPSERTHLDRVLARQAKVAFAVNYLTSCADEYLALKKANDAAVKKGKAEPIASASVEKKKQGGRRIIGYDDFYDVAAKEYELVAVCDELEKLNFARLEYKSHIQKNRNRLRGVVPYVGFPLKLSAIADGAAVSVILAYSSSPSVPDFGDVPVFYETYPSESGTLLGIVSRVCDKEKVSAVLSGARYVLCPLRDDVTAAELCKTVKAEIKEAEEKDGEALYRALDYYKYLSDLKVLYDVIGQDVEKSEAELEFVSTANTFVAEGWLPSDRAEKVIARIKSKTERIIAELSEPKEGDVPPTLVVSKKIVEPYEDITNMYSVPAYREIDPNPFMAVFFFLFFGIMIGDAGYGLVLSVGGFIILKCVRLEKGTARMIALFAMGGISAVVWGLLFGGVFAISAIPALWFNPMEEPLMMLGVSIVLGAVQLLAGYALHSAKMFRNGKPLDAVFDSLFIFVLFGGLACIALDMLIKPNAPLTTVGLALIIVSLVGILCTAGRHNKGVVSKIMGGFSGLYGLVNLLSDLLSYARLFGLGLASGAIGLAFNTLGSLFFTIPVPVVGYVIGFIILIPLHAFNLGIGVLGAYVHNARLQFLEFYGKFYEGDGRMFSPMGEKTKYVRFG